MHANPAFPGGKVIVWTVQGQAATGEALAGATGSFASATQAAARSCLSALLSRGELVQAGGHQSISSFWPGVPDARGQSRGSRPRHREALARHQHAQAARARSRRWSSPTWTRSPPRFPTNYPAGVYQFLINTTGSVSTAAIGLSDGLLPTAPRLLRWQKPPRMILGQPLTLEWACDSGGAAVSYVTLRVEQGGRLVFASPLPDSPGALNAASNSVVVPADVFTKAGLAEVSISAFSFTELNTNAIPGLTLHTARHRTSMFELRVVDGATPPPTLRSTNLAGFAVGEPYLFMLRTTNGARPIQFTLIGGALPPGLVLEPEGMLAGQASGRGHVRRHGAIDRSARAQHDAITPGRDCAGALVRNAVARTR